MPLRAKWIELFRRIRLVLIFTGIAFGLTIIITILFPRDDPSFNYLTIWLPISIVGGIFLSVLVAFTIIKINDNKAREVRLTWMVNQLETPKGNENLEELSLTILKYSPDNREKKCSICLLDLKEENPVVQCTRCEKLFHQEHFMDWLIENENCPNCKNLILPFD
ncbi:MAG: hypothetical protein KAJ76_00545 [Candidatus Heimdallarchaeota archaeon]|nr:hypothetical protein [Candidatus Heimdallarchaeota archaeon]MCK5159395.1 hypothetical protein [Candidatus Heimdallarchaeota archaeon]MCK5297361.1 hypothetical protein [Candidatus Heimdallarchaeota archaeon]